MQGYRAAVSVSNWCKGTKTPRMDKVDAMCKLFNCRRSDLMELKTDYTESYYLNREAQEMAQFLFEDPEYKVLFDASRKVKPDDLKKAVKALGLFTEEDDVRIVYADLPNTIGGYTIASPDVFLLWFLTRTFATIKI